MFKHKHIKAKSKNGNIMKNKIIGIFSLLILVMSLIITPKVEAFAMDIVTITCGDRFEVCVTVTSEEQIDIYFGGVDKITIDYD